MLRIFGPNTDKVKSEPLIEFGARSLNGPWVYT